MSISTENYRKCEIIKHLMDAQASLSKASKESAQWANSGLTGKIEQCRQSLVTFLNNVLDYKSGETNGK